MSIDTALPGLDRLIAICRRHSLSVKLSPTVAPGPRGGDLILGEPLDPQLAAVYKHLGGAEIGPMSLYRLGGEWLDLVPWNERLREDGELLFTSSLIFGQETGFSWYYGTVPQLAGAHGLQPVVHIDGHEILYAVPVASSVDRFFDAYSRYLELMVVDPEYVHHGVSLLNFPWDISQVIARDEPLMEQVHAGRFDFLTNNKSVAIEWLQKLRATQP